MANLSQFRRLERRVCSVHGANTLPGPGRTIGFCAAEELRIVEGRLAVQFRLETYNTFNLLNSRHPGGLRGSDAIWRSLHWRPKRRQRLVTSAWSPRQIQVGLKLIF